MILNQIKEFIKDIPPGWNKPTEEIINKTIEIHSMCQEFTSNEPDIMTIEDGSVILIYYNDDQFVDVFINNDMTIDVRHESGFGADYEVIDAKYNTTQDEIIKLMNTLK